ncbi:TetR/AcrR family transcriptional regulator [Vibrio viridaestus]|uniref:TetR/AcrR family transcriptional regulator n=1 Tax=Vibrio viridaestus TaxID=2487322 RepID=A0A3N9TG95_9VIBR|nr:TetR/AcrR family transcriptional regulator [Vibrio viridaestus]RQW62773.1 TetR/AcrR family transcriptional regulator [Vibrio viridaestus]
MARTGRPREFNRDDAVKKAMNLFWQKGFEGTSLADLRKTLNLSAASFYAAFGSKSVLYAECLDLYTKTCGETLSELENYSVSAKTAIQNMLKKTINLQTSSQTPSGCMAVLSGLNCCDDNKEVEALALSVRKKIRSALIQCVDRGFESNEWKHGASANTVMMIIDTFINGISIQTRDGIAREELLAACDLLFESL